MLLLLFVPLSPTKRFPFNWPDATSHTYEAAIDAALQDAVNSALPDHQGTIIVMDARTGRIRAIANPEVAYGQTLMPGSAMKPFTALAALRAGLIDEGSRTVCPGRFTGLNFSLACVHGDHLPPFSPSQAIAYSCNYYFATTGQRLGRDKLIATLREFDFGQATGISEDELSGVVRPCEIGSSARVRRSEPDAADDPDCLERAAVGESDHIQVTPIQLLTAYAALVNGGHLFKPQVASADRFQPVERSKISITTTHRAIILDGMRGAITYGTARAAKLDSLPLTIIGKTGTALPPTGFRNNGWFVGFAAPFQSSGELDASRMDLAILVLLPRAHGSDAAKLARTIFETYANEISHAEADTISQSDPHSNEAPGAVASTSPGASSIKVHLVRENVTETLSLEDYVAGVLRAEGAVESEPEALKALAITIRTYALKNTGRHATQGYDFCSTTHCQRFVSRDASVTNGLTIATSSMLESRVAAAVRATEGQVMLDDHADPIDAYFGASCGGETANIRDLWGVTPEFYLRGVRDEYCVAGPHAKWTDTISQADLLRAMKTDSRTDVGNRLDQVSVSKRDETGRAELITLEGEQRKTVRGWDFKIIVGRALGWNVLKSSRFEIARSGSNFIFRGSGFGHGLGLCQEGAHVMAARGASYEKILEKYFPGTVVKKRGQAATAGVNFTGESKADVLLSKFGNSQCAAFTNSSPLLTIASDHFSLSYPAGLDRRTANQILTAMESTRDDYLRRASAAGTTVNIPRVAIRLNESTGDFTSRTGQPWWAAAATQGSRIELQPVGILKQRGVLFTTLRHELAHIIIDSLSNKRAPRWLEEGFALYLAAEGQAISRYVAQRRVTEAELEQRLEHPRTQVEMRTLYAEAYLNVVDLIRRDGEPSVWTRLRGS